METMSSDERRKILKAGGTPPPREEDNGHASNGKPRRRRGNKHTEGRFQTVNDFVDVSQQSVSPMARSVWLTLWRETKSNGLVQISHGQIAAKVGISRRSSIRLVNDLVEAGLCKVVSKGNSFEKKQKTYQVYGTNT
jgi:hypothetical protein